MTNTTGYESSKPANKVPKRPDAEQGADSIDELVDRLREAEGISEDMAQAIANNWQQVLGGVVVIMVAVWLYGSYQERETERQQKASELFSSIQTQGSFLSAELSAEEKSKSFTKIEENLKLLTEGYADSSYNELGGLASAVAIMKAGETKDSLKTLDEYLNAVKSRPENYLAQLPSAPNRDLIEELGALAAVRAIVESNDGDLDSTFQVIESLAAKSSLITAELLLVAFRLDDARGGSLAKNVIGKISAINSPLAQQFQESLERAGVNFS